MTANPSFRRRRFNKSQKTSDLVRGQETRAAASDPKILLHICCAPCATYPVAYLRSELGMEPTGFYNPNIHPQFEYQRRLDTFQNWAADSGIDYYLQSDCDEGRWRSFPTKQSRYTVAPAIVCALPSMSSCRRRICLFYKYTICQSLSRSP